MRKIIYTTNVVENYHPSFRKITKAKSVFPSEASFMKVLNLATMEVAKKWTGRIKDWSILLSQLKYFYLRKGTEFYMV